MSQVADSIPGDAANTQRAFSKSVDWSKPTLEGFSEILELLARELHDDADPRREEWIRGSLTAAGTKLRALRFIFRRSKDASASLLDVGAQIGSLAIYAAALGVKSAAVDLPYFHAKFARASRTFGVDYRACDVLKEGLPVADQSFDYVTYLDVIEHHHRSPKRVLDEIHRALKPGGCVIITTPNQASIYNRLRLLRGGSVSDPFEYFFREAAEMDPYPGHHREYVRGELRSALRGTGFRVVECRAVDEDFKPQYLLAKRNENGRLAAGLWNRKNEMGAAALGRLWSAMRLPFGRVLWAVGEKI
jgi:2-polyprenyl-3-methyl-5-hydroxy-6-metoxy-1,4-benzoquinol methylase